MVVELVGVSDIARMLGVTQQRASQIVDAYDDFPEPAATVGTRRAWQRQDVEQWMERHPERQPGRPRRAGDTEEEG